MKGMNPFLFSTAIPLFHLLKCFQIQNCIVYYVKEEDVYYSNVYEKDVYCDALKKDVILYECARERCILCEFVRGRCVLYECV